MGILRAKWLETGTVFRCAKEQTGHVLCLLHCSPNKSKQKLVNRDQQIYEQMMKEKNKINKLKQTQVNTNKQISDEMNRFTKQNVRINMRE